MVFALSALALLECSTGAPAAKVPLKHQPTRGHGHGEVAGHPHWHVHMMAVDPRVQGRGFGSDLLAMVLAQTADQRRTLPTVLSTHRERNVTFYARHGFEVCDERLVSPSPGVAPYAVWGMIRGRLLRGA